MYLTLVFNLKFNGWLAFVYRYDHAARNIEVVGCWLGNYLRQMRRAHPEAYLWGIGHSLGAHLVR